MKALSALVAIAAAAFTLAACGGNAVTDPPSSDNALVCQHYLTQRAWVKSLVQPTVADALKFETDIAADAAEATPNTKLARDLNAMSDDMSSNRSDYAASKRVYEDCTR